MRCPPDRQRPYQERLPILGQAKTAAAPVLRIRDHLKQATTLQRLDICRKRGPVHRQERRKIANARRIGPVERDQQGILAVVQAKGPQRIIKPARNGTRRALQVQAKAAVPDFMSDGKRQVWMHGGVMLTSTYLGCQADRAILREGKQ